MPGAILLLGCGPAAGHGQHKAPTPGTHVVADVHDHTHSCAFRSCGIPNNIVHRLHHRCSVCRSVWTTVWEALEQWCNPGRAPT